MKLINKMVWKHGGSLTFVILATILMLVTIIISLVKPVLKHERISNVQKDVALMGTSLEAVISSNEISVILTLLNDSKLFEDPDSIYTICEHLVDCSPFTYGASFQFQDVFGNGAEYYLPTVIKGDVVKKFDADYSDLPAYARWDSLVAFFDEHNNETFLCGDFIRFSFIDELVLPFILPISQNRRVYDGFVIVYIRAFNLKNLVKSFSPYSEGKTFMITQDSLFMLTPYDSLFCKPAYPWLRENFGDEFVSSIKVPDGSTSVNVIHSGEYTAFVGTVPSLKRTSLYIMPTESLTDDLITLWKSSLLFCLFALIVIVIACIRSNMKSIAMAVSYEKDRKDMETAATIQKSMLSEPFRNNPGLDIDTFQVSAKLVGGDLYYVYEHGDLLYFCIGDVSGKGIPAAMFMSKTVSLFRNITRYAVGSGDVAEQLNQELIEHNDKNMFVTMFIGILNKSTGVLNYCNAGHDEPIFWNGTGTEQLQYMNSSVNLPLGIDSGLPFSEGTMQLNPGSFLMLYTDGVNEAMNSKSEQYGTDRLLDFIRSHVSLSSAEINAELLGDIHRFVAGNEQSDDITMVTMKLLGNGIDTAELLNPNTENQGMCS